METLNLNHWPAREAPGVGSSDYQRFCSASAVIQGKVHGEPRENEESALGLEALSQSCVCVHARVCVCVSQELGLMESPPPPAALSGQKLRTHGDVGMGGQKDDTSVQAMKGKLDGPYSFLQEGHPEPRNRPTNLQPRPDLRPPSEAGQAKGAYSPTSPDGVPTVC